MESKFKIRKQSLPKREQSANRQIDNNLIPKQRILKRSAIKSKDEHLPEIKNPTAIQRRNPAKSAIVTSQKFKKVEDEELIDPEGKGIRFI